MKLSKLKSSRFLTKLVAAGCNCNCCSCSCCCCCNNGGSSSIDEPAAE